MTTSLPTGDSTEVSTVLTDLIARTPTSTLADLADHTESRTPAIRIALAFSHVNAIELNLLRSAGNARIARANNRNISLLDLLASATVQARTGTFYVASSVSNTGDAVSPNTPCGVLRDGCFLLPAWTDEPSSGFAAPRLTAMIDTLWLIWPGLSNQQMHRLLSSCTKDLGAPGVDPIFGQGLLDFGCVIRPSGGLVLPGQVSGVRGALYGASTASTALTTYDAFGRDFEHQVLHKSLQNAPGFDPFDNALVHNAGDFLELTANERITSVWLIKPAAGNLRLSIGVAYEGDALFGMTGSGHFAIYDGTSIGVRLQLDQPLSSFWNMRLSLAHYQGTASASYPGAVSDLALEQSNSSIAFERRLSNTASASFRAVCSSGNSGSFNSFGTPIQLFGASNCSHSIGAQILF